MRRTPRGAALLLLGPLTMLLTACGGEATGELEVVSGVLRQTGGPPGVSEPGVPGTVTFRSGERTVEAKAAEDGTFAVRLAPGTYEVEGRSPTYGGGEGICRAEDLPVSTEPVADLEVACLRR